MLSGDPNAIPPSVAGAPLKVITAKDTTSYTGKICEIMYDCFGDFEGFMLDSCCSESRLFKSHEKTLGELLLHACRDRLLVTITVDKKDPEKICGIKIRC